MNSMIQSLKGTRDYYPEVMAVRSWLYATVRQVSESFGYQEYDGPFLEPVELYAAKSGDELVEKQSYVFEDRGGNMITLRPELTPSLARMIAQRQNQLAFPLRWWSFGPFWRYERPQKGRTREFFQWNIDMIGNGTPAADAELIAIIATFFRQVGLTPQDALIFVNNRRLMEVELKSLGVFENDLTSVFRLIDRKEKLSDDDWETYAGELGLTTDQIDGLKNLLANATLWQKSEALQDLFPAIRALGVEDFVQFSPNIIRGLDYYTGTVFEAQGIRGKVHRSILGGGRYDNLLSDVGGERVPATGFAMGDLVITLILEELDLIPEKIKHPAAQILVTTFDHTHLLESLSLTTEL
ncbi:MAG: histidine--tRNA ligase, partial [Chloroflexi bacterium RBG_16_47_49]